MQCMVRDLRITFRYAIRRWLSNPRHDDAQTIFVTELRVLRDLRG